MKLKQIMCMCGGLLIGCLTVYSFPKDKVRKNAEKYPVEKAYGHKEKYTELGE